MEDEGRHVDGGLRVMLAQPRAQGTVVCLVTASPGQHCERRPGLQTAGGVDLPPSAVYLGEPRSSLGLGRLLPSTRGTELCGTAEEPPPKSHPRRKRCGGVSVVFGVPCQVQAAGWFSAVPPLPRGPPPSL